MFLVGMNCGRNVSVRMFLVRQPSGPAVTGQAQCLCGRARPRGRIVGGKKTDINEWPWQAGLIWKGTYHKGKF